MIRVLPTCLAMLAKGSNTKRLWLGVGMASLVLLVLATPSHAATVIACQDINGSDYPVSPQYPCATTTTPGTRTLVALDVASVTTGGTAVTALTAGHRTAGGFIQNPSTATINLCINELAAASGTTTAGSLVCIIPGQTYNLSPATTAVSVVSSDSTHAFGGYGLQ